MSPWGWEIGSQQPLDRIEPDFVLLLSNRIEAEGGDRKPTNSPGKRSRVGLNEASVRHWSRARIHSSLMNIAHGRLDLHRTPAQSQWPSLNWLGQHWQTAALRHWMGNGKREFTCSHTVTPMPREMLYTALAAPIFVPRPHLRTQPPR
jgi:hypothetical protein